MLGGNDSTKPFCSDSALMGEEERRTRQAWVKGNTVHFAVSPAKCCRSTWLCGSRGRIRDDDGNRVVEISPQATFASSATIPAEETLPSRFRWELLGDWGSKSRWQVAAGRKVCLGQDRVLACQRFLHALVLL